MEDYYGYNEKRYEEFKVHRKPYENCKHALKTLKAHTRKENAK